MKIENAKFGLLVQEKSTGNLFRVASFDKKGERSYLQELFLFPVDDDFGQSGTGSWKQAEGFRIYKGEKIEWDDVEEGQELQLNQQGFGFKDYGDYKDVFDEIVANGEKCFVTTTNCSSGGLRVNKDGNVNESSVWIDFECFKQPRKPIPILGV